MITPSVQVIERLNITAPLGLRFHDQVTGAVVSEGLNVWLYEPGKPVTRVAAQPNLGGVYVIHHAPGMIDFENGLAPATPPKPFVVAVTDTRRRFQPFQFTADLPHQGIFNWPFGLDGSPPAGPPGITLYSTPARAIPAGLAVMRADLWDAANQIPAAWAVLEAFSDGKLIVRGVADERGCIALIFPYPEPIPFAISSPMGMPLESPPASTGPPLANQVWPITLRALYAPLGELPTLPGLSGPERRLPDLRQVLAQGEATLWADAAATERLEEVELPYGRELVLRSSSSAMSPPGRQSTLAITPAGSPP